jgi:hypothetical protein
MNDIPSPHCSPALDGFLALGREYREEHGLGNTFDRNVRNAFLEALASEYWKPIKDYLVQNRCPPRAAAAAAGFNRSTSSRWVRSETVPSYPTICLLFAWSGLDMKGVAFPDGREALWRAFFRAVGHVRRCLAENDANDAELTLDRQQWECVRLALSSTEILEALRASEGQGARLAAAADGVARDLGALFPKGRIRDGQGVQSVLQDWLIPWVLFCTVIPYDQRGAEQ